MADPAADPAEPPDCADALEDAPEDDEDDEEDVEELPPLVDPVLEEDPVPAHADNVITRRTGAQRGVEAGMEME